MPAHGGHYILPPVGTTVRHRRRLCPGWKPGLSDDFAGVQVESA